MFVRCFWLMFIGRILFFCQVLGEVDFFGCGCFRYVDFL